MKRPITYLAAMLLLLSCEKDFEEQVIGNWTYRNTEMYFYTGFTKLFERVGGLTLSPDGTGSESIQDYGSWAITWEKEGESAIKIYYPDGNSWRFEVLEIKKDEQTWEHAFNFDDPVLDTTISAQIRVELWR